MLKPALTILAGVSLFYHVNAFCDAEMFRSFREEGLGGSPSQKQYYFERASSTECGCNCGQFFVRSRKQGCPAEVIRFETPYGLENHH